MKKKMSWIGSFLALSILMAAILSGCGGGSNSAGASSSPDSSTGSGNTASSGSKLKKEELNWYVLGAASPDTPKVMAQFNKMLEKDMNTTVKLNFTTWDNWQTKYNLLLTSGEKVDMVFASTWADFYKYASQGAFMDLSKILPQDAPKTWKEVPKQDWNEVTLKGKIYAVPSTYPEYTPDGWVYREDWRKKLNLPPITDLNSMEQYMAGVKKAMPNVTPIKGSAWNEISTLFRAYYDYQYIGGTTSVVVAKSYNDPRNIIIYPFTSDYVNWVKKMKKWADAGFWSKDTLSSKKEAGDYIKTGQGAIYWRNPAGASGFITGLKKTNPDIQMGYFPFTRFHHYAVPDLAINNGMAIPISAAHPNRSLMVLDKIRNDPKYFDLMTYGIQGYNYSMASDGKHIVIPAKGKDPKKVQGYNIDSWGWRYEPNMLSEQGGWSGFNALVKEFKAETKPNIYQPIYIDYTPVQAQVAAINQVEQQYGKPLMMGLVSNVDDAVKTYREKLKQAGVEKLRDYIKKQADAYYDEKGIQ